MNFFTKLFKRKSNEEKTPLKDKEKISMKNEIKVLKKENKKLKTKIGILDGQRWRYKKDGKTKELVE